MTPQYQRKLEQQYDIEIHFFKKKDELKAQFSILYTNKPNEQTLIKIKVRPGQTYKYAIQRALHTQ